MERAELINVVMQTGCAEVHNGFTFLCDAAWTELQRVQVREMQRVEAVRQRHEEVGLGWLCVPTGGTSGGVRFARHDEQTLGAAVQGFCEFFGTQRVNAIDVLPGHHVSGLMARVRCAATRGSHVSCDWRRVETGDRPALEKVEGGWVISLVPTQLHRLLASVEATEWLREFRVILIGGAPVWPELAATAAVANLPVALSYGLTETAAMVAAIRPQEFRAGERTGAMPLPHAKIDVATDTTIRIEGASVFRGYFPGFSETRRLETEDFGRIDESGRLHVLGRKDSVIITGGKKVQPLEVEMALRNTGQFKDVAVIGVPDNDWGQVVVACYRQMSQSPDLPAVEKKLAHALGPHQRPKRYVAIADWPRNAQGKLNRSELGRRVEAESRRK
jgi:O-succinylbenzoic acid--CoA ligase